MMAMETIRVYFQPALEFWQYLGRSGPVQRTQNPADASVLTLTIASVIPGPAQQEPGTPHPSPLNSGFALSGAPLDAQLRIGE